MLAVWAYIEADFQREYGIVLADELNHMSWRRFNVLLRGLSSFGALANHYDDELKKQREDEERESEHAPSAVQSFWSQLTSFSASGGGNRK